MGWVMRNVNPGSGDAGAGFVAIVRSGAIGATFPSYGAGFVAFAARATIRATKPALAHQQFVARATTATQRELDRLREQPVATLVGRDG
jgi:hypothetical protein